MTRSYVPSDDEKRVIAWRQWLVTPPRFHSRVARAFENGTHHADH